MRSLMLVLVVVVAWCASCAERIDDGPPEVSLRNDPSRVIDIDGDGFADAITYVNRKDPFTDRFDFEMHVYYGSPDGLLDPVALETDYPDHHQPQRLHYRGLAPVGDLDGDGRTDHVIYSVQGQVLGRVVYGAARGDVHPQSNFTEQLSDRADGMATPMYVGDLDGDGFDDLVMSPRRLKPRVYFGGPGGVAAEADLIIEQPFERLGVEASNHYCEVYGVEDVDRDGFADIELDCDSYDGELFDEDRSNLIWSSRELLYGGARDSIGERYEALTEAALHGYVLPGYPFAHGRPFFTQGVAALASYDDKERVFVSTQTLGDGRHDFNLKASTMVGPDLNGDGLDDLVRVQASTRGPNDSEEDVNAYRNVQVWLSPVEDDAAPDVAFAAALGARGEWGFPAMMLGDVNGDGFGDMAVTHRGAGELWVWYGARGGPVRAPAQRLRVPSPGHAWQPVRYPR